MRWPWKKTPEVRQSEIRQSGGAYTDAIIDNIVAAAGGTLPANPTTLGAVEAASGLYAAAFAGAKLIPDIPSLTPSIRANIARQLVRTGEALYLISVERGALRLDPIGSWDIRGSHDPATWMVRACLFGPSGNITKFVPYASVIHARWSYEESTPWRGRGPLAWSHATANLASHLEQRLSEEASGAVAHVVPVPQSDETDEDSEEPTALQQLRQDLAAAKGKTVIAETTSGGWGDRTASPQTDWQPRRLGANFPATNIDLRNAAALHVLNACQVPAALFTDSDGTAQREAYRRWTLGPLTGMAALVMAEVNQKLDTQSKLSLTGLWGHDLAGRAAAFARLRAGEMSESQAVKLAGLEE